MTYEERRNLIMDETIAEFNKYGIKFTMDQVSQTLHISKKTIYTYFIDKETLLLCCIDRYFDLVKEKEAEILNDDSLDYIDKLKKVIIAQPAIYDGMDWSKVSETAAASPTLYARFRKRLNSDWDATFKLIEQGVQEGKLRECKPEIIKVMIGSSIEGILKNQKSKKKAFPAYMDAMNDMVDLLLGGLIVR